ncbi:hypothetical protein [Lysinibacillus sphaericus]|uniref:hypothetical protein n=1 Tax=Lysinibacillus sphaericus TaxID=1421 RepID=UPI001CC0B925|nr:hypothetical protein [Lysinibacillus sphaericus]
MGISGRGTKAKSITSCDNAFVTNILLPRDPGAQRSGSSDAPRKLCSVRKRSVSGKCFICAKAKRQLQSARSERKSTTRYVDDPLINGNG